MLLISKTADSLCCPLQNVRWQLTAQRLAFTANIVGQKKIGEGLSSDQIGTNGNKDHSNDPGNTDLNLGGSEHSKLIN